MRRVVRTDALTHIELLSLKDPKKALQPLLPLESDDVDAFKNSPLCALVSPDDDLSEVVASFMGPGPWTFHQDLKLPALCSLMRITNKNRRSNTVITHILKCAIRVERGDGHLDPKSGKRKMYEIIEQTPIRILSVGYYFLFFPLSGVIDRFC
jgi:arrestin-related trafficking adapter 3/6